MACETTSATGRIINFLTPNPASFSIRDIAIGLARAPRFAGHTDPDLPAYTVAEHSVWVSRHCPLELAFYGLLHDASEAYMLDVPSPLKAELGEYKKIEFKVSAAIYERFGIPAELVAKSHATLKYTDNLSALVEARDLRAGIARTGTESAESASIRHIATIRPVGEIRARAMFLDRFIELKGY